MLETVVEAKAASEITCKAFLLRVTAKVKHSRYLRLFSPELGLIECVEKRAFAKIDSDKIYAQFISNKSYYWPEYSYAECKLFRYKNKYYLKDFTLIYHFQALTKNILAYTCSQVFNDLLVDLVTDADQAKKLWPFYLHALYALQKLATSEDTIKSAELLSFLAIFILRVLAESGYKPDIDELFKDSSKQAYQFSFAEGKLATNYSVTSNALPREQTLAEVEKKLNQQTVSFKFSNLLHVVLSCQPEKMANIELSEQLSTKLYDFAKCWLIYSLDRHYESQDALAKLIGEQLEFASLLAKLQAKRKDKNARDIESHKSP
ncbi:DNA repair protein RecO [Amygdalobacter nucleatus]|uniref:DNA repair protein RecO n=1 Tax=Amygdalobacter nucleatus TaxID=3029274 RepID=UPI0027998997|nr:DNA repair protein RecO C-terminal domain-containing protein [Amygdalobacter nucleatus]WEG37292.1 DNA repair protein RecO C-terminal domain-containing protein [Amygdalobacter nucleatus]